jgi:O-antigen/teichoic acid export membrane protein
MTGIAPKLRDMLRMLEISKAVLYSVALQGWSAAAGFVTIILISSRLDPSEQGYYYTFSSAMALQVFVELGLGTVIIQVASHEWAGLRMGLEGRVEGSPSALARVRSLLSLAMRWYAVASVLLVVVLVAGGFAFFDARGISRTHWQGPWILLCLLCSMNLSMTPLFALLEGCNQVTEICRFRLSQGVLGSLAVIAGFSSGCGLYSLPLASLARLVAATYFVGNQYRPFFTQLLQAGHEKGLSWRREVLPFQIRASVTWASWYFMNGLLTPAVFYFQGAGTAGQVGMTLAIISGLCNPAYSWLQTRMPQFGVLIAKRDFQGLDRAYWRVSRVVIAIGLCAGGTALALFALLERSDWALAQRVLPLVPAGLLVLQAFLTVAITCFSFYLRAHKQEPQAAPTAVAAVAAASLVLLLVQSSGPTGAAAAYVAVSAGWLLPTHAYLFFKWRRLWHAEERQRP